MNRERVLCPVCGPRTQEVVKWTKSSYRYVSCTNCGMVYINPQLSDESVADIYSNLLYDHKSERLDLLLSTLHKYKSKLLKKFERFRRSGRLLDVGCFKGFFLYSAAQRGWETFGTEVSEPAARFAREELGQQVARGDLLKMNHLQHLDFDVMTFFDVIEHVSRPDLYLERAHNLLRAGGLLYMETPNINSLPRFVLKGRWTVFNSLHRYYFTPRTMERILRQTGFEKIKIHTVGFLPLGAGRGEPTCSRDTSKPNLLRHMPIGLLRNVKDVIESSLFFPLDVLGLQVGTKMVIWATKGA
jgi:2-polyprenyl-3-methyl-5-hydroxy-6-metoxy-1,4-benzoquinol methylase